MRMRGLEPPRGSWGTWRGLAGRVGKWFPSRGFLSTVRGQAHRPLRQFPGVWARIGHRARLRAVRVYAVLSKQISDEALELFVERHMAELMVEKGNRDEPDRAGELYVAQLQ